MTTRQNVAEPELLSYYVSAQGGDFVLQIRADWKVTFGAINPGVGNPGRYDLHCLRVWEGEKLRGVFCDVRSFRDLSIPLLRKVSKETGSAEWTQDSEGNYEAKATREIEASWADEAKPAF